MSTNFGFQALCTQISMAIKNIAAAGSTIKLLLEYQENQVPIPDSAAVLIQYSGVAPMIFISRGDPANNDHLPNSSLKNATIIKITP